MSRIRNLLYDKEFLDVSRFPYFVISVGNLTWGGTGKTTLTGQIGRFLLSRGYRLAVVSRGYGRKSKGVRVVHGSAGSWQDTGDEIYLLSQKLPEASFVAAEDRRLGLEALEASRPQVVLLDDAFQHRKVARNLDLALIDASENLLKQRVIPFGKLREPVIGLLRADAVILTHAGKANAETEAWISRSIQKPVFRADYVAVNSERWAGKKIGAFCALGSPHHFFRLLHENGADVAVEIEFKDHHNYCESDVAEIEGAAVEEGAEALITSAKDAVKLQGLRFTLPLMVAEAELRFEDDDAFYSFVLNRIVESS